MATAYAALVSLMHIIEQIKHHPHPPVCLDKEQVQSLQENVAFLQDFLEYYHRLISQEYEDGLVIRIADAAHAAEDVIENHVVDRVLDDQSTTTSREDLSSIDHQFYQDLQKVIADMDLIKKQVIEIKVKIGIVQDPQLHRNSNPAGSLSSSILQGHKQAMVGRDDALNEIMDKLTRQQSDCLIIPIVGMGGIGKTTLARNVYENPLIVEYFDIRAWVTVSQEYNTREILLELVCPNNKERKEALREIPDEGLGEMLYKCLCGRRYLIVMDDIWSIEAWNNVKLFFPNNNSESRIMVTTRLANLAWQISGSRGLKVNFLDTSQSWDLFCKIVFGEEGNCPLELEEIGKTIAKNCQGLPLSVIVIGGILAKSKKTRDYWEYIAENLSSVVNLDDNERCLRILYMSYKELPVHLKPCFLYMGVLTKDNNTYASRLRKLWVAEGFVKSISGKSLEEAAEEYLKNLIDRNLIIGHMERSRVKIKSCSMHDLIWDLCLREAKNEKFLCSLESGQCITMQRRIVVHERSSEEKYDLHKVLHSAPLARSLTCNFQEDLQLASFRLLRVLKRTDSEEIVTVKRKDSYTIPMEAIFKLVNCRYLVFSVDINLNSRFLPSMHLLWNLQTLIIEDSDWRRIYAPPEIWKMHQLRHVHVFRLNLPDPLTGDDGFVLSNLQKMSFIENFRCSEAVVKRIPNIKKLRISYHDSSSWRYYLENLGHLQKLESLDLGFIKVRGIHLLESLSIMHSLRKLTLWGCLLQWEDITTSIGLLPHLQVLRLLRESVTGHEWETVEGHFCHLTSLIIDDIKDLEYWKSESSHFPCLNQLLLRHLRTLNEIPLSFGGIQTLELIALYDCSDSAVISAKEIAEQQEELGNEDLLVFVSLDPDSELRPELKSSASRRFRVILNRG